MLLRVLWQAQCTPALNSWAGGAEAPAEHSSAEVATLGWGHRPTQ